MPVPFGAGRRGEALGGVGRGFSEGTGAAGEAKQRAVRGHSPRRGVPQGQLLLVVVADSLRKRLKRARGLWSGLFADGFVVACAGAGLNRIRKTNQQGPVCVTNWLAGCRAEASPEKAEYTLFVTREANLLRPMGGKAVLKRGRAPKPFGPAMCPCKWLSERVRSAMGANDARLMQLRAVASPE
ncbi:hypothetical protein TRVL_09280 [Trypanosoma vivax]|nr:hypothetical protein TRVL_09280 [Trypanosoma vivax]